MFEMLLLMDGNVLIIKWTMNGTAGWEDATSTIFNHVSYSLEHPDPSRRFRVLSPSHIPRMYHSTTVLVQDGWILVVGSNPHSHNNFTSYPYPTYLSIEAVSPPYLGPQFAILRPSILFVESPVQTLSYSQKFEVNSILMMFGPERGLSVGLMSSPFTTHFFGMSQRLLFLEVMGVEHLSGVSYKVTTAAPQGFVVHDNIPSRGVWVMVQSD